MRRSDGSMTESASGSKTMNRRNVVDKKSFMSGEIKDFVFSDKQKFHGNTKPLTDLQRHGSLFFWGAQSVGVGF